MSTSSLRVLLISSDSGLRDRLRETLDQIPGKTWSVEWVDSSREAMGALTRQEYDIYFVALNGGQDEAATILRQAPARGWAKPIIFLSEQMSPEVRCQLLRNGAAGCLRQDQLNAALLEYAIEHALEFARATQLLHQSKSGELTGFTAIGSEITERKRIEEELRLRDRAMGAAAEGIVISDPNQPDNPLIYVNDGFERLTGYSRSEVLGRNCRFLQGAETDSTALELIRECIRERRECHVELLNYRKDGTPFWNRLSIAPLREDRGRLTHFVGVQSDITARKLAEERLAAANTEILASNNRMKQDLEAAAKVQQALLPTSLPRIDGLEFAWLFKPTAELAGDQLNIMRLDETHIALYLLDVSGHGVPSSLMAVAASLLLSRRRDISTPVAGELVEPPTFPVTSPAEAALVLNQQFIRERTAPQYLTLVYGMLNVNSGEFRYVSAGHPGPILVPKDAPPLALEAPTGLPIGLLAGSYEERCIPLHPGDRIYLYSDGVTEAMNAAEEQFGVQRLLSRLCLARELSLKESLNDLLKSLEEWRCQDYLLDDVSLVALEWKK
jgi:PAS domain S-box-containing protein